MNDISLNYNPHKPFFINNWKKKRMYSGKHG